MPERYLGLLLVLSSSIEVSNSILLFVIDTNACFIILLFMMFGNSISKPNYMTQMNERQWMYGDRRTSEFIEGLHNFGDVARENI